MKDTAIASCLMARVSLVLVLFVLGCGGKPAAESAFNSRAEKIIFSSSRALDGSDAANANGASNIWIMTAEGDGAIPLTALTAEYVTSTSPAWSQNDLKIAFDSKRALDNSDAFGTNNIWIMNVNGTGLTPLTTFTAVAFGEEGVFDGPVWSPDGSRLAFKNAVFPSLWHSPIWVINSDGGNAMQIDNPDASGGPPTWSPDGTELAYSLWNGRGICRNDLNGGWAVLTTTLASYTEPAWSPDGSKIAFSSDLRLIDDGNPYRTNGALNIWVINVDGTDSKPLTSLTSTGADSFRPVWSPDGTRIAFESSRALDGTDAANANKTSNIWVMNADGSGAKALTSLTASGTADDAVWSPDGAKIAFTYDRALDGSNGANANGTTNIWVMNADGSDARPLTKITAANANSSSPQWVP